MEKIRPNIFNYTEPRTFLNDVFGYKNSLNPAFSARAWSKLMGFKAHTTLVYLLKGQRRIRPQHINSLLKGLRLEENEAQYFGNLVHFHNCSSDMELNYYETKLKSLHPQKEFSFVELEQFRSISNWHHMAILEMTLLNDFKNDPQWISQRLNNKITPAQVTDSIERLLNLGLLMEDDGKLIKTQARLMTPKNRTSEAIRQHHKQVLQLAYEATDKQNLDQRYYNSCAMTVDAKNLKEATDLIISFRSQMAKLMEKSQGDQTYQLSIQFFNLTDGKILKE